MFSENIVIEFREKLLKLNKNKLPVLDIETCYDFNYVYKIYPSSKIVMIHIYSFTEEVDGKSYIQASIDFYTEDRLTYKFHINRVDLSDPIFSENSIGEIIERLDTLIENFLLPKLFELRLPIFEDAWNK